MTQSLCRALLILNFAICSTVGANDWSYHDGMLYRVDTTKRTYADARAYCQSLGGDLPILKTPDENEFVRDLVVQKQPVGVNRHWIGLKKQGDDLRWRDGSILSEFRFWAPREPFDNDREACVTIITNYEGEHGKWSTEICDWNFYAVCSKPCECPDSQSPPQLVRVDQSSFEISWSDTGIDGDCPVQEFSIYLKEVDEDAEWKEVGSVPSVGRRLFCVTSLQSYTPYYVRVTAILEDTSNDLLELGPSLKVTTSADLPVLLERPQPSNVRASSVELAWSDWSLSDQGMGDGPIKGYYVSMRDGREAAEEWTRVGSVVAGVPGEANPHYKVVELEPDSSYSFAVSVVFIDGAEGPMGPLINVTTTAETATKSPRRKTPSTSPKTPKSTSKDGGKDQDHACVCSCITLGNVFMTCSVLLVCCVLIYILLVRKCSTPLYLMKKKDIKEAEREKAPQWFTPPPTGPLPDSSPLPYSTPCLTKSHPTSHPTSHQDCRVEKGTISILQSNNQRDLVAVN